jgi:hypothetical protein
MTEMADWNSKIIEEFRASGGKVGGQFEGAPLLLLHTVGAREQIWAAQKAAYPGFADYEQKTTRQIPVIVLEPAS